jgi:signal transduction histidine kinase
LTDGVGAVHEEDVMLSKLRAAANAPIFSWHDAYFGKGIVGGPLISVQARAQKVANVAVRILHGEVPSEIKVPSDGLGKPKFDWRELQRWGISEGRLPQDSEIYFRDPTAWEHYRPQILAICAAIIALAALISWLLWERRYRRHAETVARDARSELIQMNRLAAAGELSASIAHEINQPLTGIAANASAARRWLSREGPDIDKIKGILDQIERAADHATGIIKNLRTVFKRDTGDKSLVDINKIILTVLALGKREIEKHQIKVEMELGRQLPSVIGNEVQIQQVVLNVVMNATEAMHSVQPRILRVQSHLSKSNMVNVSIEDTGTGIDPSNVDRVFKPLFSTKAAGMGMGLSVCQSIIESHNGRIWASAGVDRGSIFQFELPTVADNG